MHFYDDSDLVNQKAEAVLFKEKKKATTKETSPNITSLFKCNELLLILNYKRHWKAGSTMRHGSLWRRLIDFSDYKTEATENSENIDLARRSRGSTQGLQQE